MKCAVVKFWPVFLPQPSQSSPVPPGPQMTEEERLAYYQEAMKRGLESRLVPPFFTCIGKMKVVAMVVMLTTIVCIMATIVTVIVATAMATVLSLAACLNHIYNYLAVFSS